MLCENLRGGRGSWERGKGWTHSAIDRRIPLRLPMISRHERVDPRHRRRMAQTIASVPTGPILDIEHSRQGASICRPAPAVSKEVVRLRSAAAGGGLSEVVAAADQAGCGGARVMRREGGVAVSGAFGGLGVGLVWLGWKRCGGMRRKREDEVQGKTYLDDHEAGAIFVGGFEVYVGLIVGDIEALDGAGSFLDFEGRGCCVGREEDAEGCG